MEKQNALCTASLVIGIMSLIAIFFGMSLPLGALGIVLAILSRGAGKLEKSAIAGLITSIIGLVVGLCVIIFIFALMSGNTLEQLINRIYTQYESTEDSESYDSLKDSLKSLGIDTDALEGGNAN